MSSSRRPSANNASVLSYGWNQSLPGDPHRNLNMYCVGVKFVLWHLTLDQSNGILMCVLNFMRWLITSQLLSVGSSQTVKFRFTAMTWRQNNSYCSGRALQSPRLVKTQQVWSVMLIIFFFNIMGIVHWDFVPANSLVNSDFYSAVLRKLKGVWEKRPELWCIHTWLLSHTSAATLISLKITQLMTEDKWHSSHILPPCSPDLVLFDFALFLAMKLKLSGCCFDSVGEIQTESQVVVDSLQEKDFHLLWSWGKEEVLGSLCTLTKGTILKRMVTKFK